MKKFIFSAAALVFLSFPGFAQFVGINNPNPQTALDVDGQLRFNSGSIIVNDVNMTVPFTRKGLYTMVGSLGTNFNLNLPPAITGSLLLIENATSRTATTLGNIAIRPNSARLFLGGANGWIQAHETPSELEKITEGSNTGWRLLGSNPNNFGNIGQNAVDLSTSPFTGTNYGATGEGAFAAGTSTSATEAYAVSMGTFSVASGQASTALGYDTRATANGSFAMGWGAEARGFASTGLGNSVVARGDGSLAAGQGTVARTFNSAAFGRFNDTLAVGNPTAWIATDHLFVIGNGSSNSSRSNAVVVYKNGNADLNGFTRFGSSAEGSPRIKVKKITATLNGVGNASVAHGLTFPKIVNLSVRVANQFGSLVFAGNTIPNNSFNAFVSGPSVVINAVVGSNGDIINQEATILVTYEE